MNDFIEQEKFANKNINLKLDFNERSDSLPYWIDNVNIEVEKLWQYPNKTPIQKKIGETFGIDEKQVMVSNGGDEAIELLLKFAKINNKKIILPLPAFSQYLKGIIDWELEAEQIESQQDLKLDIDKAIESLKQDSILILTSPNNPTGETISYEKILFACQNAEKKGALLFIDQAYIEFSENQNSFLELIKEFNNVLLLRTLSKAYGLAGIRVGYLLGNESLIKKFSRLTMPFNVSRLSLQVAEMAFSETSQIEVEEYCQKISKNRKIIYQYLINQGLKVFPSEANFLLVSGRSTQLNFIVATCRKFDISIKENLIGLSECESDKDYIRITIPENIDRLVNALKVALEPELISFDMDGVLIDAQGSYDQCIRETVKVFTNKIIQQIDIEKLRTQGGYNNDWKLTQKIISDLGFDVDFNTVKNSFQEFYEGKGNNIGLKQNDVSLISPELIVKIFINQSKSIKTAIVTGRPKLEAFDGLQKLLIKNTLMISNDDVIHSKPNPEGINKAKKYYQSKRCWMIGDTPDDMQAACEAGVLAIGICDKKSTYYEEKVATLYQAGADIVLENVNQIGDLL